MPCATGSSRTPSTSAPGEGCGAGGEVEYHRHMPEDYRDESGRVWAWGCHWDEHAERYGREPEYATAFDAYREANPLGDAGGADLD